MTHRDTLRLGTLIYGTGQTVWSWLDPKIDPRCNLDMDYQIRIAREAEAAGLDFLFLADGPYCTPYLPPVVVNHLEPITLLSALAAVTSRIGLIPSISTSFTEPFNVARQLASLDHISGGRVGWNVVTTAVEAAAFNFSRDALFDHDDRYARAEEHVSIVRGLWDSWEDDAFLFDRTTKRYFDPAKLHALDHAGKYYSVKGPMNIARPPQGHPVIVVAGSSDAGVAMAAQTAELVFTGNRDLEPTREQYRRLKAAVKEAGRDPNSVIMMPGIAPIVGSTDEEAERRFLALRQLVGIDQALADLSRVFGGYDFTRHDLDAPFPNVGDAGALGLRSRSDGIKANAAKNGLTLREAAFEEAIPRTRFVGSAERIADEIERWFREDVADGFILNVGFIDSLTDFVSHVLPLLRRKGLYREDYVGSTLRENLGLPFPPSRYA